MWQSPGKLTQGDCFAAGKNVMPGPPEAAHKDGLRSGWVWSKASLVQTLIEGFGVTPPVTQIPFVETRCIASLRIMLGSRRCWLNNGKRTAGSQKQSLRYITIKILSVILCLMYVILCRMCDVRRPLSGGQSPLYVMQKHCLSCRSHCLLCRRYCSSCKMLCFRYAASLRFYILTIWKAEAIDYIAFSLAIGILGEIRTFCVVFK